MIIIGNQSRCVKHLWAYTQTVVVNFDLRVCQLCITMYDFALFCPFILTCKLSVRQFEHDGDGGGGRLVCLLACMVCLGRGCYGRPQVAYWLHTSCVYALPTQTYTGLPLLTQIPVVVLALRVLGCQSLEHFSQSELHNQYFARKPRRAAAMFSSQARA